VTTIAIIWLCGAVPLAVFLITSSSCLPIRWIEWLTLAVIVAAWPLFLAWAAFEGRPKR